MEKSLAVWDTQFSWSHFFWTQFGTFWNISFAHMLCFKQVDLSWINIYSLRHPELSTARFLHSVAKTWLSKWPLPVTTCHLYSGGKVVIKCAWILFFPFSSVIAATVWLDAQKTIICYVWADQWTSVAFSVNTMYNSCAVFAPCFLFCNE